MKGKLKTHQPGITNRRYIYMLGNRRSYRLDQGSYCLDVSAGSNPPTSGRGRERQNQYSTLTSPNRSISTLESAAVLCPDNLMCDL